MKPKQIKEFGYPPKIYNFTGEYSKQTQGCYKAMRNKRIVYTPIYKNDEGETINDMTQIFDKGGE